jgi:hypothetical protein
MSKINQKKLFQIAKNTIGRCGELKERTSFDRAFSDELDFIDGIPIWEIENALTQAYLLGKSESKS